MSEEDIIDNASSMFHQNKGHRPSEFCYDTDRAVNANTIQTNNTRVQHLRNAARDKLRYKLICCIEHSEGGENITEEVNVHVNWGGQSRISVRSYPE